MHASVQTQQTASPVNMEQGQYLTFLLAGETFAIGISGVKEIIEYGDLTTVPMMPEFIRGVINLRGSVVPVVDLAARFGKKSCTVTKRTCIVIIEVESAGEKQDIGMMVDAVSAVIEIPQSEIEQTPAFGARIRTDFIAGMGKVGGKFIIILNVDHVLSIEEMAMVANVGQGEAPVVPSAS